MVLGLLDIALEESAFTCTGVPKASGFQYLEHICSLLGTGVEESIFPTPGSSLANSKRRDAMAVLIQALSTLCLPSCLLGVTMGVVLRLACGKMSHW